MNAELPQSTVNGKDSTFELKRFQREQRDLAAALPTIKKTRLRERRPCVPLRCDSTLQCSSSRCQTPRNSVSLHNNDSEQRSLAVAEKS